MLICYIAAAFDKSDSKPKYKQRHYTIDGAGVTISERVDTTRTHDAVDRGVELPSQRDAYWGLVSFVYQKLKLTPIYKQWKHEQFNCQFGKCGICGKPMDRGYTQLDHIKARYDYGTNYSNNLVLVHPRCNENKGAHVGVRPSWIKENSHSKEFDKKAWEIIQAARQEYPDNVPDSLIKPPDGME